MLGDSLKDDPLGPFDRLRMTVSFGGWFRVT
jgi:hypothetical protein